MFKKTKKETLINNINRIQTKIELFFVLQGVDIFGFFWFSTK